MADPSEPNKPPDPLEEPGGRVVGHYRLLRKLGAGGMGEVYLAEDTTLKRQAAVKLLPAEMANDSAWRKRFLQEARNASALNHPSIATIYEAGTEGQTAYIAMEYVEGETVRERLKRPLAVKEAVAIARQVAQALAAAHRAGVIHHDIKPANIMLAAGGGVKVLDFGLARRARTGAGEGETVTATLAGSGISGTPGYAAPEQLQPGLAGATEKTDARADLFALGAVAYEMLAGRPAFQGGNLFELCHAVLTQSPAPVESLSKDTPSALARVVARCLEKEPAARYQCAADLALDLDLAATATPGPALAERAARPHSPWVPVAAALVVGIAVGTSVLLWHRPQRPYWKIPASPPKQVLRHSGEVLSAGLAPDGNQFAYVLHGDLYLQTIGGGEPRRLTNDGVGKNSPRFSPEGNRLIFAREAKPALYVLDLPAGIPRLFLEDASKGVWSPNGSRLAFIRPSTNEAFVADADGKEPRSLGPAKNNDPRVPGISWAPDGKRLAIVHEKKIYVVSANGQTRKELPGIDEARDVVFTPDGDFLLVELWKNDGFRIWQIPARGGNAAPLLVGPYQTLGVTISRDGNKLLATIINRESHLAVAEPAPEANQGRVRQITFAGDQRQMALSPDEKRIAYTEWGSGRPEIWMVNVDGSDPRQLTAGADFPLWPSWSPDGKAIVYFSGLSGRLWTVRLDEGISREFPTVEGHKTLPSYTTDGKHIVFQLNRGEKRDIWMAPAGGGQGTPLTSDGASRTPRAAPVGSRVAYVRQTAPDTFEVRIVDYVTRYDRVVVTPEAFSKFKRFHGDLCWSRDGRFLFLRSESGLLRVTAEGGAPEKFSFPTTSSSFDVFSDYRRILLRNDTFNVQPWLYDDLQ